MRTSTLGRVPGAPVGWTPCHWGSDWPRSGARATSTSATAPTSPTRTSRRWRPPRTPCSTPPARRGIRHFDAARSYGRAEAFLGCWLARRGLARRRRRQLEVGLRVHRELDRRRRAARGQGATRRAAAAPVAGDARRCSATACSSTRSTRRRWRAACSTTAGARGARRAARAGHPGRAERDGRGPGGRRSSARSRPAASTRSRRPGTCTSARAARRSRRRARPACRSTSRRASPTAG